jgi:hypothetical protein
MLAEVYERGRERFDIIHSHIDYWTLPFSRVTGVVLRKIIRMAANDLAL